MFDKKLRFGIVATAIVVALVPLAAPSALAVGPDIAQAITVSATGQTARDVAGPEFKSSGIKVDVATSATRGRLRTLVQDKTDGVAVLAVLNRGQSSATFNGLIPVGSTVTKAVGGDYNVETPAGNKLMVHKPWAKDAAGHSLPTSYTFAGRTITQTVNTAGAVFPVVADPWLTLGWFIYEHFDRHETFRMWNIVSVVVDADYVCGVLYKFPAAGALCVADVRLLGPLLRNQLHYAVTHYNRCVQAKFLYTGQPIAFYTVSPCN